MLGHGSNAADWNGKFFTELAAALAAEGDNISYMHVLYIAVCFLVDEGLVRIKLCRNVAALAGCGGMAQLSD